MNKILYTTAAIALVLGTSVSCSDMLDIQQHGALTYDNFYKNDEQITSANAAMYYQLRSMEYTFKIDFDMLSDDYWAGGGVRGDNPILEKMNEYTYDANNDYLNSVFTNMYTLIYKANVIIGHVDPEYSPIAKQAVAEAHFFRGYAYFYLTALYGNPPMVDHELAADEYWQGNCDNATCWAFAESELKEAINSGNLCEKSSVSDNTTWRITKQVAQAILGKVYLWQGKYSEAAEQFNAVVNSGKYKLFTEGEFGDMDRQIYKHNSESMIEVNRTFDNSNPGFSMTMTFLTRSWRVDKMTGYGNAGIYSMGWGFCGPSMDLYEAFVKHEGKDGYRLNQTIKTLAQLNEMGIGIIPGQEIPSEGVFTWKGRNLSEDYINSPFYNARNIRYMRYAEVLLCGAEASLKAGDAATALNYINQIRQRARLSDLGSVTMDDIKIEKRLELVGEMTRYMDLVRWGDAYDALKDKGAYMPYCDSEGNVSKRVFNNDPSKYGFKKDKHELWPYPATEIDSNPNIEQNKGY